jgi:hypothetical protein
LSYRSASEFLLAIGSPDDRRVLPVERDGTDWNVLERRYL